jgi:hypothetical protein
VKTPQAPEAAALRRTLFSRSHQDHKINANSRLNLWLVLRTAISANDSATDLETHKTLTSQLPARWQKFCQGILFKSCLPSLAVLFPLRTCQKIAACVGLEDSQG